MLVRALLLGVLKVRWQLQKGQCRLGVVVGAGQGAVWHEGGVIVAASACLATGDAIRVLNRVLFKVRVLFDVLKCLFGVQAGCWCL